MLDVERLRDLRDRAAALVRELDAALADKDEDAPLRTGRTMPAIVAAVGRLGVAGPKEIAEELRCAGREVTDDAVAQGCLRLARKGRLAKRGTGAYALPGAGEGGS